MAGASVTITVEDTEVRALLTRIAAFGDAGLREALDDIGAAVQISTRERAAEEKAPDGTPWHELAPLYAKRKAAKRPGAPMLKFDNHMLGDRFSYQVGEGFVDIGTNAPYGAIHQFGGTPGMAPGPAAIPAREWLGLSDQDQVDVIEILGEHLQAALDG